MNDILFGRELCAYCGKPTMGRDRSEPFCFSSECYRVRDQDKINYPKIVDELEDILIQNYQEELKNGASPLPYMGKGLAPHCAAIIIYEQVGQVMAELMVEWFLNDKSHQKLKA